MWLNGRMPSTTSFSGSMMVRAVFTACSWDVMLWWLVMTPLGRPVVPDE